MTIIQKSAFVPYTVKQMFDLVNDIASYPLFLPWCSQSTILSQTETEQEAVLGISQAGWKQSFSTRNRLTPFEKIEMRLLEGPFRYLEGKWVFQPLSEGCDLSFKLSFEFNNKLLAFAMGPVFNKIGNTLVEAFSARAHQLYGSTLHV